VTYLFKRWEDGSSARPRSIPLGSLPLTYKAYYEYP
jgi:hypothetical protein